MEGKHRRLSEDALLSISSRSEPVQDSPLNQAVELTIESESDAAPTESPADSPDFSLQDLHPDIARQLKSRFKQNGNGLTRAAPHPLDSDSSASSLPTGRRPSRSRRASIVSISQQLSDRSAMVDHLEKASTTAAQATADTSLAYVSDDWAATATMIQ